MLWWLALTTKPSSGRVFTSLLSIDFKSSPIFTLLSMSIQENSSRTTALKKLSETTSLVQGACSMVRPPPPLLAQAHYALVFCTRQALLPSPVDLTRSSCQGSVGGMGDTDFSPIKTKSTFQRIPPSAPTLLTDCSSSRRIVDLKTKIPALESVPYRCDRGTWPPAIPLPPLRVFSGLRPTKPVLHGRLKPRVRHATSTPYMVPKPRPFWSCANELGRLGRDYANDQSSVVNAHPGLRNSWPRIALFRPGRLRQHHRHHHRMVRRAAIPSLLDETLNLRDFHVMGPGPLATRVWMVISRASVSAEHQTEAYESDGGRQCVRLLLTSYCSPILIVALHPVLPGRFLCVVKLATQKSPRPPTVRHKRRQTHSATKRRSHLLYLLERPPQINISRSLAYASHVLENAKSPAMEFPSCPSGSILPRTSSASELMNPDPPLLYVQIDAQPNVTLDLLKSLASLHVESSIFPPGNNATRISVSGYPPISPSLKSCGFDSHIHKQMLHGTGLESVFETAQPMLQWKIAGTIKQKCSERQPLRLGFH
ncbi:hypothetical protein BKA70DRAFT_1400849 [Coprinopsis sp. MPI-PUGE-AT-0042]|nr:hypothetical protein BKA70DRAFT_1400849 [Coprinopsis sp. MPI-PUGE-AT-0042]